MNLVHVQYFVELKLLVYNDLRKTRMQLREIAGKGGIRPCSEIGTRLR